MSDKKPDPFVERMEKILLVLDLLPEEKRFDALGEMAKISQAIPASDTDTKVEGEGHTVMTFNNVGGDNDVTFGSGGWSSKKRSNSTKSGKFKVQSSGPYLGDRWIPVYDAVRLKADAIWECEKTDGAVIPPHTGTAWDGKGKGLALSLNTEAMVPVGYYAASQDELRHVSGPANTRLAFRKPIFDAAVKAGLIVKSESEATSETENPKPDASPTAPEDLFAGVNLFDSSKT